MNTFFSVAITSNETDLLSQARLLAQKNLLPYVNYVDRDQFDYVFVLTSSGLYLEAIKNKQGKLKIDFLHGKLAFRIRHLQNQKQLLAKAIGLKPNFKPIVLDVTAGLGRDGFILAKLGCAVTLLERSPFIFILLEDGLKRALKFSDSRTLSITLINIDAHIYLEKIKRRIYSAPDVIYLDPMYPHSNKTAFAKREMRLLRFLVGNDSDAFHLLKLAMTYAKKRVVVKRPRSSIYLAEIKPNYSLFGKQHRLDVYLTCSFNNER
ncbi:class I SAM-dependent methyltransferase [Rickettsiella grylli]|uniref:class I SAM-dependent methyltransferase n=1 Tax=Rickettsiella grylli TaxID=59196 RepID=UPI0000DAE5AC|nr:class I SAM-dependent methyltransferase [Rickettsiella grylli]